MLRALLFIHRYLAVAVGLLMALWCLSGFVMLYQQYPTLTDAERLRGLPPLQLDGCCQSGFLSGDDAVGGDFSIQMQRGVPVLLQEGSSPFDLASGTPLREPTQQDLLDIAAAHARASGIDAEPRWLREGGLDQWTLLSADRDQRIAQVAVGDAAGTHLYLARDTGELLQDTSRRERVLSWLGAIPHWLYPISLRQHASLWSGVVIWAAVLGTFLAATGLYVGVARWRRRSDGRRASPFLGWWYWHHVAGLIFGVLALTWVFSGLLTMNPWGLFDGSGVARQIGPRLSGAPQATELKRFVDEAPARLAGGGFVRLRSQPLGGRLFVLADRADGSNVRLDALGNPAPLTEGELRAALAGIDPPMAELSLLPHDDAYYYSHKDRQELPVWRAILGDAQRTRIYIGANTGQFRIVDGDARTMRWLERGLHGLDFAGLRTRPLWDIVALLLLTGVTVLAVTGAWMALQRLRKDLARR
jgi:uncharacterized iron-regulated membrane protein